MHDVTEPWGQAKRTSFAGVNTEILGGTTKNTRMNGYERINSMLSPLPGWYF